MYGFVLDFAYVLWVQAVAKDVVWLAGLASVFIALPAILGYTAIFSNKWMIVPYLAGLFTGTVVSMSVFN